MALSLPGERSVAAASPANILRMIPAWFAGQKAARTRRLALQRLLDMDPAQLRDLGISRGDIADAMQVGNGRTPSMVLNAARARSARF
ncbi:DUF1127 domain-containing protein [Devosia rhizoryzae]|uniref:DUF1127 domain-containing protein n=1 Tax=Devosia rhizoryzae TaxID=2774137 RepID=A0ABX7C274_9HYPH|nr:DUF1127 domain-containing protein [Devosia rhizoryzae]QQR38166.1 DUF1127 domain-containing protein [Devosia rhizoryzae]